MPSNIPKDHGAIESLIYVDDLNYIGTGSVTGAMSYDRYWKLFYI